MKKQHILPSLIAGLLATAAIPAAAAQSPGPLPQMLRRGAFPWADPFNRSEISGGEFAPACRAQRNFTANEFLLDDLPDAPPKGLGPYAAALRRALDGRRYPGSWDGYEPVGIDRKVLEMSYADLPVRVREWVEELGRREAGVEDVALRPVVAVFERARRILPEGVWRREEATAAPPSPADLAGAGREAVDGTKVVVFAPGAIYPVLPLWVAEGSDCEDTLLDLAKYSHEISDGGVVAWITKHTKARRAKGRRDVVFTIEAQVLKRNEVEKAQGEHEVDEL